MACAARFQDAEGVAIATSIADYRHIRGSYSIGPSLSNYEDSSAGSRGICKLPDGIQLVIEDFDFPGGDESWRLEAAAFADDIRLNREPTPGLAEGIRTLEIVESIYQQSGFPVSDAAL